MCKAGKLEAYPTSMRATISADSFGCRLNEKREQDAQTLISCVRRSVEIPVRSGFFGLISGAAAGHRKMPTA
jgi:hypothetical protein